MSVSHLTCFEPRCETEMGSCVSRENSSLGEGDDKAFFSSFEAVWTGQPFSGILHAVRTYFAQPCLSSGLAELPLQLYNFLFERPDIGQRRRLVVMTFVFIGNARCTSRLTTITFGLLFEFSICGIDGIAWKPTFLRRQPAHVDLRCLLLETSFGFGSVSSVILPISTSSCFQLGRMQAGGHRDI